MVDVIGRAKVIITGDVDPTSVDASGKRIGSSLRAGAAVGVAALGTVAVASVKLYQEFEEAEAQSRKLNRVLDNMGEGKAAPAVEKLADELMRLTGIDDEVIKGGQTLLATFDSVNDSAGELGGTFDRATRLSLDMSKVFGSVEGASRTLGKALESPERAAALLRRANVVLNEEQQTLIDRFLAANDAAGAQDVILDALEERYKGTAEASATESQKIQTAFEELKENAGGAIGELVSGEDGESLGSLSDALFDVSDAVAKMSKSKDWKTFGKQLRDTARDLSTVAGAIGSVISFGNRLNDKWSGWGKAVKLFTNPIGAAIDLLEELDSLRKKLGFGSDGSDGPKQSTDDLVDMLIPGGAAGGGPVRGLTLVGENGPELAQFGSGGYVYNNSQTREMLAGASTAQRVTHLHFHGPENLAEARRREDWSAKYGTRFGAATNAGAM